MTPEQKYQQAFETLHQICDENGWGDPFSYARSREIHLACILGHRVADTYSGADAIIDTIVAQLLVEYKTTIQKLIKGTYNGISVFHTWEEQKHYLITEKIGKYQEHYIARYEGAIVVEVWKMSGDDVLRILLPKLEKDWNRKINGKHKDPRLSATLTKKEIYTHGTQVPLQYPLQYHLVG